MALKRPQSKAMYTRLNAPGMISAARCDFLDTGKARGLRSKLKADD